MRPELRAASRPWHADSARSRARGRRSPVRSPGSAPPGPPCDRHVAARRLAAEVISVKTTTATAWSRSGQEAHEPGVRQFVHRSGLGPTASCSPRWFRGSVPEQVDVRSEPMTKLAVGGELTRSVYVQRVLYAAREMSLLYRDLAEVGEPLRQTSTWKPSSTSLPACPPRIPQSSRGISRRRIFTWSLGIPRDSKFSTIRR
jgi:hypothetical protein